MAHLPVSNSENPIPPGLFSPKQVLFASVFGGPLGGALTRGANHRRVGENKLARTWLVTAIGALLCVVFGHALFAWFGKELPRGVAIGLVAAFWVYAKQRFTPSANQTPAANVSVIKLTLLGLGLTLAGYFALVLIPFGPVSDLLAQKYTTPTGHVVEYDDGATHEDAVQAADALEKMGYFTKNDPPQVRIVRRSNGLSLDFFPVAVENAGLDEEAQALLRDTTDTGVLLASVRMCSSAWTCEKSYEQPVFGR